MVLILSHKAAHSAYSGDLKCTGDNKLQQIGAAWELLKLGGSLGYELNSGLCEVEHLHRGALCKHNRDPTADKIQVIKPETLSSCFHYSGSSYTHPFLSFADFWVKVCYLNLHKVGHVMSPLLPLQHLSRFLGLCQGQLPDTHAMRPNPACQVSDQSRSCRMDLDASKR